MTRDNNDVAASPADPRLVQLAQAWDGLDEVDGQMQLLGMTVVVAGHVYSGLLIAGRVWANYLTGLVGTSPAGPQQDALSKVFKDMEGAFEAADSEAEAGQYLHLVNVATGLPNQNTQTTLLMRFRCSEVSGWSIGTAGPLPNFPYIPPADGVAADGTPPAIG